MFPGCEFALSVNRMDVCVQCRVEYDDHHDEEGRLMCSLKDSKEDYCPTDREHRMPNEMCERECELLGMEVNDNNGIRECNCPHGY